jgi:hypothetical protein
MRMAVAAVLALSFAPAASSFADEQPALAETFDYPNAAQLLEEQDIALDGGDGYIQLEPCSSASGQVVVDTLQGQRFCFRISGPTGFLTLELRDVFAIKGDSHTTQATLIVDGSSGAVTLAKNAWTPVGVASKPDAAEVMLMELRASSGPSGVGPEPVPAAWPFVARIEVAGERACSGVLVQRRWVLTSARCLVNGGVLAAGPAVRAMTVTVGRGDLRQTTGHVVRVVELVPHAQRDLVLARLETPIAGVTPIALGRTAPPSGSTVMVAGYGRTASEWVPTQVHAREFSVRSVAGHTLALVSANAVDTCKGDGGGPAFRLGSAGPELVAIHTASWRHGCLAESEARAGSTETRTDDVADWVQGITRRQGPAAAVPQDVDGDGRADVSALYDLGEGRSAIWMQRATAAGFAAPQVAWEGSGGAALRADTSRSVSADFNADGLTDHAVFRQEADGALRLYALASDGQRFVAGTGPLWTSTEAGWQVKALKVLAGDVDGDRAHDLVVARTTADDGFEIWIFRADPAAGSIAFSAPTRAWLSPSGQGGAGQLAIATGNFDGDASGRADLALLRRDGASQTLEIRASNGAGFSEAASAWSAPSGAFAVSRVSLAAVDLTGDGLRDELVALHPAGGNTTALTVFRASPDGAWEAERWWTSPDGAMDDRRAQLHAGDYDGDRRGDVAIMYDSGGAIAKLHRFSVRADASGFEAPDLAAPAWSGAIGAERLRAHGASSYDADADGLSDIAALYDYDNASSRFWLFRGAATGLEAPGERWASGAGNWDAKRSKLTSGDYDGDGFGDVVALYDYDGASSRLWLFPGAASGLAAPRELWASGAGSWDWHRTKLTSGDYDGDGFSDVAALYDYDNALSRVWLFRGTATGLAAPRELWASGAGNWDWKRTTLTSSDYDGDGFSDVAALYGYDGAFSRVWLFRGTASGLAAPRELWASGAGNWDASRTKLASGDYDGDGFGDIAAFYQYDGALTRLWLFRGSATGLAAPRELWASGAGNWEWARTKLASGDYDGDGVSDIAALYQYDGAFTRLWLFKGATSGIEPPREVWASGAGNWDWLRTQLN